MTPSIDSRAVRRIKSPATELVAICRKCGSKLGGGFGDNGRKTLARRLRKVLGAGKGKRATVRIVEVPCFGICPKRAVVVARGRTPGELLIVPGGTPVAQVADSLGLTQPVNNIDAEIIRLQPGAAADV